MKEHIILLKQNHLSRYSRNLAQNFSPYIGTDGMLLITLSPTVSYPLSPYIILNNSHNDKNKNKKIILIE